MSQARRQQRYRKKQEEQGKTRVELTLDVETQDALDELVTAIGVNSRGEAVRELLRGYREPLPVLGRARESAEDHVPDLAHTPRILPLLVARRCRAKEAGFWPSASDYVYAVDMGDRRLGHIQPSSMTGPLQWTMARPGNEWLRSPPAFARYGGASLADVIIALLRPTRSLGEKHHGEI